MTEEKRKIIQRKEVTMSLPVVKAPGWLQGFVDFIREQGVVGIAVGFILGVGAKGVVDSLVNNIVNPIVGTLYNGGGQLVEKYWCLKSVDGVCTNKLGYGSFLNTLINFIIMAAVVYFIIKVLKLDKLDKSKSK
jgi:large conductance mechanosensitive channel